MWNCRSYKYIVDHLHIKSFEKLPKIPKFILPKMVYDFIETGIYEIDTLISTMEKHQFIRDNPVIH